MLSETIFHCHRTMVTKGFILLLFKKNPIYLKNIYLNNKFVDQGYKTEKLLTSFEQISSRVNPCIHNIFYTFDSILLYYTHTTGLYIIIPMFIHLNRSSVPIPLDTNEYK